jgi:hypothetical protein
LSEPWVLTSEDAPLIIDSFDEDWQPSEEQKAAYRKHLEIVCFS